MGRLRLRDCEKGDGTLTCRFITKKGKPLDVIGGMTEGGEPTIMKVIGSENNGVELEDVREAENFTLNQIKMRKLREGKI